MYPMLAVLSLEFHFVIYNEFALMTDSELCGFAGRTERNEAEKNASRYQFIEGIRDEVPEVRLSENIDYQSLL